MAAAAALIAGPGFAQNYETDIMAQLQGQGYQGIALSHTWLGRTRIVATLNGDLREIVFDPNTGEILRDLSRSLVADNGSNSGNSDAVVASGGGTAGAASNTRTGVAAAVVAGTAVPGQPAIGTGVTGATGAVIDPGVNFLILQPTGGK